jgi:hypothetical protein
VIDQALEKTAGVRGSDLAQTDARAPEEPAQTDGQKQPRASQWTSSIPRVASEDIIHIGNVRYAHFRRDRRFAQVQVVFTAPQGVDPNPGRELTGQFKELGWIWREKEQGKPWIYRLEKSSKHDPAARGDSRDALHEQFLIIIQEYRQKHGLPPTLGWQRLVDSGTNNRNDDRRCRLGSTVAAPESSRCEDKMPPSQKRETRAGRPELEMLDAFASVGAQRFDLTLTDAGGEKVGFRCNRTLDHLRPALSELLQEASQRKHNVIVRPRTSGVTLIQIDDVSEDMATKLRLASFLVLRTSPGNYQSWIAVADGDANFARRLRKGAGADLTASGATRVSGSLNFKDKYAPAFPRVETVHVSPGLVMTQAEVEALGVVAPPEQVVPAAIHLSRHRPGARGWPSYRRCLESAPKREGGRSDRSRADYTFCLLAIDWGWRIDEAAARLMQESPKAQENGEDYALRTARDAAAALEKRSTRQR